MDNSERKNLLVKVAIYLYISGLPYFWSEKLPWSALTVHAHKLLTKAITVTNYGFLSLTFGFLPLLTQRNLNDQQIYDMMMFNVSQPIVYASTISLGYWKENVIKLIEELVLTAPSVYKDPSVEALMIKKTKMLLTFSIINIAASISMVGINSLARTIIKDEVFNTIMSVWPDIEDRSRVASTFRVALYIAWVMLLFRVSGAVLMVICLMIYTSFQFKHLQSYFCSLVEIFENDSMSILEKETKYEESLKTGIKLHIVVISITRKLVKTCNVTYGGHIIMNVVLLATIMIRLSNEERTLTNVVASAQVGMTVLVVTGFYMLTLGDITIEADKLTSAMYMSGWEKCRGSSSLRVRKLLSVAMAQTQNPLTIYALAVVRVSYSSFVSIVKLSYSLFSVIV